MEDLLQKYSTKLVKNRLCVPGAPLIGRLDAEVSWNNPEHAMRPCLEQVFSMINIGSLLFAQPAEPYCSIINALAGDALAANTPVQPGDSETRTFLHDIPVIADPKPRAIADALKKRKTVIIANLGIASVGSVSPEQAFVNFSSACFACFVKFFSDCLPLARENRIDKKRLEIFNTAMDAHFKATADKPPAYQLMRGPFRERGQVMNAMVEAGRQTVEQQLVDSFFGNVSYRLDNTIFISQTGSSLDELTGAIDACPVDGSSCAGITASSELSAHKEILLNSDNLAVLHGHPKFTVITSLLCDKTNCRLKGLCHIKCPQPRFFQDIPIISGEVGTGEHGLCNTLPSAIAGRRAAIVHGHGLFTTGQKDFTDAFKNMLDIENACLESFRALV